MTEQKARQIVCTTADSYYSIKEGGSKHKEIIDIYNRISPLPVGYRVTYKDQWCAVFVSAMFWSSYGTSIQFPFECSCERMRLGASKLGIWVEEDGYMPKIGDVVLYDWQDSGIGNNLGYPDHVGIVDATYENAFQVIEGNYNDSVGHRILSKDNKYIRGFITPNYSVLCDSDSGEEPLSDAQNWFQNTFGINVSRWDDRVALTYKELAEILYILK